MSKPGDIADYAIWNNSHMVTLDYFDFKNDDLLQPDALK